MGSDGHFIVAIGASAGGLEAIHEFFDHMPEHANASFVIIQHLSPDHKSLLVELVSRHTHMKVYEAENDLVVKKNCIYVIPNNKLITIRKNRLRLEEKVITKAPNNAIDVFLYSLAKEKHEQAIAVILSGTGTDGTKGIEAIKENGGLVLVQEPASAKFNGMPNSAVYSGNIDYVLPPASIPAEIVNYTRVQGLTPLIENAIEDATLEEIFELIQHVAGFDFNYYKTPTIIRRIARRMMHGNFTTINQYVDHLREHPDECKQLGKDFLIGVTKFFRDTEAFSVLKEKVFPQIVSEKEYGDIIKVWVSACSTGEEAYSIAILLNEVLERHAKNLAVKIFATDLEESNIAIAAMGTYPESIVKDIEKPILEKYFIKKGNHYTIIPAIRKQIVFANHNLIKDPPFIKNDLVSCRNMLIYVSPVLQQKIFTTLVYSVKKEGYLFLGPSENPTFIKDSIAEVSSKWKVYQKIADTKLNNAPLMNLPERSSKAVDKIEKKIVLSETPLQSRLWDDVRKLLTQDLVFTALYIDDDYAVKEAIGNYQKILTLPKKTLQLNLIKMVPKALSPILFGAIKKAQKERQNVFLSHVQYTHRNKSFLLQLLVKPPLEKKGFTVIVLSSHGEVGDVAAIMPSVTTEIVEGNSAEYVRVLENELIEAKNNLQMAVESLETVNEELQSSNEELLSANEELQSSNEELQSLNEELHTLNTEHQLKIKELLELNDDLNNYFRSTDIGQVFLDNDQRIRKFNPASARMINFIDSDVGRPITHISTNIKYDNLVTDIERVLQTSEVFEKEVQLVNGKNLLMRILPYLTRNKKIEGVIISFIDITTITNLNNIIRGVFNSSSSAIFALQAIRDHEHKIIDFAVLTANHAANRFLQNQNSDLVGKSLRKMLSSLTINGMFEQYVKVVHQDIAMHTDMYLEHENAWYEVSAVKMMDGIVATFTDVTEKKIAEQRLKKNYVELIAAKDNLKKLNAALEDKVKERTRELSLSEERFRMVSQATNDALWDWDFVNNKVWWGDAFYKFFGYASLGDQLNRSFWLQRIHPEDRKGVEDSLYAVINNSQKQWSKEYRFLKEDGAYADILDRGYVLHDEYGTPYRMLGSMLDLTSLKRAESEIASNIAQRKFLAESMPLMVWTANAAGAVDFVNNQFEQYTGLSHYEALENGWQKVIHEEDVPGLQQTWRDAIISKSDFQQEVRIRLMDQEYRWNILRAKARKDEQGNVMSWVVTTIDIHDQKVQNELLEQKIIQRTRELREINHALQMSNHDLQQFASVASHDLQEPLRKIHMFSKLIKDRFSTELSGEAVQYLEKIMQSSSRMKSIIVNVLNFSRLSADDNVFERYNIGQLIAELLDDFEILIKERQAVFHVDTFCDMEVIPGQMRQMFQNLIGNALKFSKPDVPPRISITAKRIAGKSFNSASQEDGQYCKITLNDNGIGFDESFRDNIFELFHRLHSKDKYEGTGIGLAIVKKIVEKHNGLIAAHSRLGEGSTFEIILPLQQISQPVKEYNSVW